MHRMVMVQTMILGMAEAMRHIEPSEEGLETLSCVLSRVQEGGNLDEADDGYYSSSDDEGVVTAEMAARGVGEAGRVVVSKSIWNRLMLRDLLRVYKRAQKIRTGKGEDWGGGHRVARALWTA